MSTNRKRITVNLTAEAFARLEQLAAQRGKRYGSVANEILTGLLEHGQLPDNPEPPVDGAPPDWLELGRGQPWRAKAWEQAQHLREAYPTELHLLPSTWTTDRFARDGLLALAAWRAQIDAGTSDDPRIELAWLDSLRRFRTWLELRARETPDRLPDHSAPTGWTPTS
ncbi:hypothetical protein GKE82_25545 [Conexibacter sp. W3-3-2]|uniref:hypothetical protein n=1 Tax=Conexibacter sp. W3-3-2 TaxID=2675227 RepID=UPI0012B88AB4|nr:hypothetical protein [Conexibacter sp. W3-3-2]MTD47434.1 hypothetical protein [Conexibacter sp. W3-3-2]MTD47573.1 hypothetical protein [Conexibacter sp. W3-3-2]